MKNILVLGLLLVLVGCSTGLSRGTAKKIILSQVFPVKVTQEIPLGKSVLIGGVLVKLKLNKEWLRQLADAQLITYKYIGDGTGLGERAKILLTEKGAKFAQGYGSRVVGGYGNKDKVVTVVVGEKEFVEITGILEQKDAKKAVVEYSWKYANLTPFGKNVSSFNTEIVHTGKLAVAKYDDGWRVEKK